ncbi:hypothetical protein SCB29_22315 [Paraburkholderia sp. SIMBA_055]
MLTQEFRRVVCVHEAGHAVVHALGGSLIYGVAVAPESSESWTYQGRKGGALVDLWGVCEPTDFPVAAMHLAWDDDNFRYIANKSGFNELVRRMAEAPRAGAARGKLSASEFKRRVRSDFTRAVRLQICGILGGPIAESIYEGREFDAWNEDGWEDPGADMARADGFARLLPYRGELEHACAVTSEALRAPETWAHVIALADELERLGSMDSEAVADFLPRPLPDWPPSFADNERATSAEALG